jgi:hypothetical protein
MVYQNNQLGLSCAVALVVYGSVFALEWHQHGMDFPTRNHILPGRSRMSQEELNSFGSAMAGTNAALQQLFTDYAKHHFGSLASVQFEGPDTNGAYSVTVHMRANYGGIQTSEYSVTLDAAGTNIESWK